jgi:enediyne biosynthesis protein E4
VIEFFYDRPKLANHDIKKFMIFVTKVICMKFTSNPLFRFEKYVGFYISICLSALGQNAFCQTTFSEVSLESGINYAMNSINLFGGGAAFFDYNNDDNLDLYVTGGNTREDILFEGDGAGNFTNVTAAAQLGFTANLITYGVTTGDIDNDGDRDLFLCTGYGSKSALLINNGDGTFTDMSETAGFNDEDRHKHGAVFGDVNLDGFLDIYITSWVDEFKLIKNGANETIGYAHTCFANLLYINNGDLTFTEMADAYGVDDIGCGLVPAFSDYDNDSDMDAMAVNDFGVWVEPNGLYRNEYPLDTFSNVGASSNMNQAMYGMGVAIGDYDHDMDLDYYFTSIDSNFFMQNQGNGQFDNIAKDLGVEDDTLFGTTIVKTSWGTAFMDVDNDSYQDLYVADGKVGVFIPNANNDPNKLYLNNGAGGFEDISAAASVDDEGMSRAMIYGDYDNDGDLDIFVVLARKDTTIDAHSLLYRNELSNENNWIKIDLEGIKSNRDGFGAHLQFFVDGDSWLYEVDGGSSYRSQHQTTAHIGLGSSETVDSVIVIWPGGNTQRMYDLAANQKVLILEDTTSNGTGQKSIWNKTQSLKVIPNPNSGEFTLSYSNSSGNSAIIRVLDLQGRVLFTQKSKSMNRGKSNVFVSVPNLKPGLYIVELESGSEKYVSKILINGK